MKKRKGREERCKFSFPFVWLFFLLFLVANILILLTILFFFTPSSKPSGASGQQLREPILAFWQWLRQHSSRC
jgi:hypothetical protein